MLKRYLFITLIIVSSKSFTQDFGELEKLLLEDICTCFSTNEKQNYTGSEIDLEILKQCIQDPFVNNEKKFKEYIAREIDTTAIDFGYQAGYEIGQKIYANVQDDLIHTCDPYYRFFVQMKDLMFTNINTGITEKEIDSTAILVRQNPTDVDLLWQKGSHQLGLGNFTEAEIDFKKCLELNPKHFPSLFFLGFTYDRKKNYSEAIQYYQAVIDLDIDLTSMGNMPQIYLYIAQRELRQ